MKNNITEVFGLDVAVIGYCQDDAPRAVSTGERCSDRFRKLFLDEQGRVIGAVLIGETNDAGVYYQLVRARGTFPGDRLLHGELRQATYTRRFV